MNARAEAERILALTNLVEIGAIGLAARKASRGNVVMYGRVAIVPAAAALATGAAPLLAQDDPPGEVRITAVPESRDEALDLVQRAKRVAAGTTLTGFALSDLDRLAAGDRTALVAFARELGAAGLAGVAEVAIDQLGDDFTAAVRAVLDGGLTAKRAVVIRAPFAARLDLIARAEAIQKATGAFAALAPLPRQDPADTPSTGYEDVKTIVAARVLAPSIPRVQVDWPLYGPKLAQVAIEYGADDVDGIAALDFEKLGVRRSPKSDIERQIRSAFAEPAERDGRYERLA